MLQLQDEQVATHIREAIRKEKLQKEFKRHIPDVTDKARSLQRKLTKTGRYKVVAGRRAIQLEGLDTATEKCEEDEENTQRVHCECDTKKVESESGARSSEHLNKPYFYLYDIEAEGSERTSAEKVSFEKSQIYLLSEYQ